MLPPASPLYHNSGAIVIADSGPGNGATNAAPYPAPITVAGQVGFIRQIQVTLVGVQHPSPQDLGVLLLGPNGAKVVLMSGAGGNNSIRDVQLVFADSASGPLPAAGTLTSGSFRASNLAPLSAADFPDTGNANPISANLSAFNGILPNGNWQLFVRDFTGNSKGEGQQIAAGWMINFITESSLAAIADQETPEDTAKRVGITIGDDQPGLAVVLTASSDNTTLVPNANFKFEPGLVAAASQVLVITPASNQFGEANITVTAKVGASGVESSRTFKLRVTAVNDDPVIAGAGSVDRSKPAGLIDGPLVVTVSDQESAPNDIVLTATSSNTALIPNGNIILRPYNNGSGNWDITIVPNGRDTGETIITLSAQVGTEKPATKAFKFTVTRNRSFVSDEGRIEIRDNATGNPYPSTTRVSGMSGVVSKVSVTLLGLTHSFPDDIDLLLVSPNGSKSVILLADTGGGAPTNSINNITMTFDDEGQPLTSEEKLSHRTYKPTNSGSASFPSPAPGSGHSATLSAFNGIDPNGEWRLYVVDDTFSDNGAIERGWVLIIETAPSISPIANQTTREDTTLLVGFTIGDSDTDTHLLKTWALSSDETLVNNTNLLTGPTNDLNRTLSITPSLNKFGTNLITVYVADNRVTNSTQFGLTVTAVDDPPTITTSTNLVRILEDQQTNIVFNVRDVDSILSVTNARITSGNAVLVPNNVTNLSLAGANSIPIDTAAQITATVKPDLHQFGESILSFTLTDGTTPVSRDVTLAVTSVNDAPTISVTNNAYSVNSGQTLANIPVTVTDVETPSRNLILSATSGNKALIPDANIVLGGANENRLLSVTPIGTGTGIAVITLTLKDDNNPVGQSTLDITITVNAAPGKSYANTAVVTIRDNNTANIYPSAITVPALEGKIHQVSVTIDGFTHSSPDDVDILLVGPNGQKVLILSDAGGNIPISNGRLVFDDNAPATVPDNGPLLAGSHKPSNYGGGDAFASPAPVAPYAESLSAFNGLDPEGVWQLFVVDDTPNDSGSIGGGWSLKIVTTPAIATSTASPVVWDEDTTAIVNIEVNDLDAGSKLDQLELFSTSSNGSLIPNAEPNVVFNRISGDENSLGGPWGYQVRLTPSTNSWGTNLITIGIRRKSDRAASTVVLANTVRLVNDAPQISRITEKTTDENQPITITFLVTDVDTDPKDLSIRATSGNETLISNSRLQFPGPTNFLAALSSSELSLTMQGNTNQTGTALITLLVTDNSTNPPAASATSSFNLRIVPFNDPPVISAIPDIAIPAGSTSTNIAFTANDSDSGTIKTTATSSDETLVRNANIRIFRDQAGTLPAEDFYAPGPRWIRVTSEVGKRGAATITVTATDGAKTDTQTFVVNVVESRERGFANTTPIVINDNGPGNPYPSIINVSELVGDVSQVRVRLTGFAHGFPSDTDILLVSPAGKSVMLMSDAGGGNAVTNLTLTFTDGAPDDIPQNGPLVSGTFRTKNYDPAADPMASPAPAAPYGTTLGSLAGTPANGEWKLFIIDDTTSDSGFITGGWDLFITTQPRIVGLTDLTIREDEEFTAPFTIVEESFADPTFTFSTASTNSAVIATNELTFRGSGTNWTLTGRPVENVSGVSRITVFARNPYAQIVSNAFTVTVNSQNDDPFITDVDDITIFSGTASAPVAFTYGDPETPQKDLIFTVSSSNTALIPTNNVFIVGGFLQVAPVGNMSGSSLVTLTVADPGGATASTSFTVTVRPALNPQFANSTGINIPVQGKATPYPSTIDVSRVGGAVSRVTVTVASINHAYPSDIDVMLVGPQGQKVVLMSDAGGSARLVNSRFTFDDRAAAGLPFNPSEPIANGTYKPTNHQGVDDFPDAPPGTTSATLDVFAGTDPNGVWSLYVVDDAAPDGGSIVGGWILNIFSTDPTISAIADQTTDENVTLTVPFTVEDADTPATNLVVVAGSDNAALLGLTLSGTGNNRVLTVTPTPFASGSGTVTLGVTDGTTLTQTSFLVTVNPVNQAPEITGLTDRNVPSNVTLTAPFTVFDRETPASNLVVTATISRAEFGNVTVTGDDADRNLVFRSSGDQGQAFVTVDVDDGTTNTTQIISITVGPPYELVVSDIADQTMVENASPLTVGFTVTGSTSGAVTVTGEADNAVLVNRVAITGSGENWNATVTLNPSQSGESLITVTATDDLGGVGTSTFKLTVQRADRPPVLGAIPPQQTRPNVPVIVPLDVTDPDTPPSQWVFTSTIGDVAIVRNVVFGLSANGGFVATINPTRDATGTTTVTIHVSDGFTRVSQSFPMTVIENPPTLGPIADQSTTANTPVVIPLAVQDIDTPIAELVFSATSSNPALVAGVTFDTSSATVTATVNLVKDATGVATVTISVRDSASTASQVFALQVTSAAAPQLAKPTVTTNPDGSKTLTVTWQNGGELEYSDSAVGPWLGTGNTSGTYSEPATSPSRVFRVRR
ncbi:MAG: proprotein convertase P-domain-containing protein [Limisphaerales bacterium]